MMEGPTKVHRLLILAEEVLFHSEAENPTHFHPQLTLGNRENLEITVWTLGADEGTISELSGKFGVDVKAAPHLTKEVLQMFDFVALTYDSLLHVIEVSETDKDLQLILVYNLWDTKMGIDVAETTLAEAAKPIEHVIGAYGIIPRVEGLISGKVVDRIIGIFILPEKLIKFYEKKTFFEDFENFKFVPIYANGSFQHHYSLIIAKMIDFNVEGSELHKKLVDSFISITQKYPIETFFINPKVAEALSSRESFLDIGEKITAHNKLKAIHFLDMYPVYRLSGIDKAIRKYTPDDLPLILKPNSAHARASEYAHVFAVLDNWETLKDDINEVFKLYTEQEEDTGPQLFIQKYIHKEHRVIKGYVIGHDITVLEQEGYTEEERLELQGEDSKLIDYFQIKKPTQEVSQEEYDLLRKEISELAKIIKKEYSLEVFGFDLLKPTKSSRYFFIDINQFHPFTPVNDQWIAYQDIFRRRFPPSS